MSKLMSTLKSPLAVAFLALLAAVALAGCLDQLDGVHGADPVIVDSEQRQGVLDVVQGETTIAADVENRGETGRVRLTAAVLDEDDVVLDRINRTAQIEANETRRITMTFQVPQGAERYRLNVEGVR